VIISSLLIGFYLSHERKVELENLLYHSLIVDFGNRVEKKIVTTENGSTVFDVLNKTYEFEWKEYGELGKMILSINGMKQNSTHSWIYYVNGILADKAADKYVLTTNSTIEWFFLKNEDIMKLFSEKG